MLGGVNAEVQQVILVAQHLDAGAIQVQRQGTSKEDGRVRLLLGPDPLARKGAVMEFQPQYPTINCAGEFLFTGNMHEIVPWSGVRILVIEVEAIWCQQVV